MVSVPNHKWQITHVSVQLSTQHITGQNDVVLGLLTQKKTQYFSSSSSPSPSLSSSFPRHTTTTSTKNGSWGKHSKLIHESKSILERLTTTSSPDKSPTPTNLPTNQIPTPPPRVLHNGGPIEPSLTESELILSPILHAYASGNLKIADPALNCIQKLISHGYLRGTSNDLALMTSCDPIAEFSDERTSDSQWVIGVDPDVSEVLALLKNDDLGCSPRLLTSNCCLRALIS